MPVSGITCFHLAAVIVLRDLIFSFSKLFVLAVSLDTVWSNTFHNHIQLMKVEIKLAAPNKLIILPL